MERVDEDSIMTIDDKYSYLNHIIVHDNPITNALQESGKEVIIRNKKVNDEIIDGVVKRLLLLKNISNNNTDSFEIIAKSIIDFIREKDRLN